MIALDTTTQKIKLFVFETDNFTLDNKTEYALSELINDNQFEGKLRFDKQTKLAFKPDFEYKSVMDSWRFSPRKNWNSLTGIITTWDEPKEIDNQLIRKEHFDYIELSVQITN
ncbi:MAG: hypothetical protein P8N07_03275 [Flavobacteriales bacterium]|nr:hypothetical protein [Flavobacteriales bacterium]